MHGLLEITEEKTSAHKMLNQHSQRMTDLYPLYTIKKIASKLLQKNSFSKISKYKKW